TNETRILKQVCTQLEHRWRSTRLEVFRHAWPDNLLNYKNALSAARTTYYSNGNKNNPKFLFDKVA
ncbi:hypothetical protein LDENG_00200510, partial [Lucifuga dentata]